MVKIYLHHGGDFSPHTFVGKADYFGGRVEITDNVDTDKFHFGDIDDFAK